jgi:thiamine-phosphate diphosphorylase
MVTDRLRLDGDREQALVERVGAAARAGVHLIQVRERDLAARPLTRLVERCVEVVRGTRARVVVNDRVDVALAAGAHGVHLRGDSMAAARARIVAPPAFLIGRSVHSPDDALRAQATEGLDYLVFGTVFATASKPGALVAGLDALARVAAATRIPVIAIGGMNGTTITGVGATGAAGFAAIGLFADQPPDQLQAWVQQASLAFDTLGGVP